MKEMCAKPHKSSDEMAPSKDLWSVVPLQNSDFMYLGHI